MIIYQKLKINKSFNFDAMDISDVSEYDLVYIDTSYISKKGRLLWILSFF